MRKSLVAVLMPLALALASPSAALAQAQVPAPQMRAPQRPPPPPPPPYNPDATGLAAAALSLAVNQVNNAVNQFGLQYRGLQNALTASQRRVEDLEAYGRKCGDRPGCWAPVPLRVLPSPAAAP